MFCQTITFNKLSIINTKEFVFLKTNMDDNQLLTPIGEYSQGEKLDFLNDFAYLKNALHDRYGRKKYNNCLSKQKMLLINSHASMASMETFLMAKWTSTKLNNNPFFIPLTEDPLNNYMTFDTIRIINRNFCLLNGVRHSNSVNIIRDPKETAIKRKKIPRKDIKHFKLNDVLLFKNDDVKSKLWKKEQEKIRETRDYLSSFFGRDRIPTLFFFPSDWTINNPFEYVFLIFLKILLISLAALILIPFFVGSFMTIVF